MRKTWRNIRTVVDIDFEGNGGGSASQDNNNNDDNAQDINGGKGDKPDINDNNDNDNDNHDNNDDDNHNDDDDHNSSTGELNTGDTVEFEGVKYTVDEKGNLVDDKGVVFKEAKDVKSWLDEMNVDDNADSESGLNLAALQEELGVTVTDDEGKPIEFTDDAAGVKAYVNEVINLKSKELQEGAVNKLYQDNPLLKQFVDYVQITGTPRGFGEIPDRSGIELDKDNVNQQEAIIRMAAEEFGNKMLNNNYINYLKESGGLYDEAKAQLAALVQKDKDVRKDIETRAAAQRAQAEQDAVNYWKNVSKVIDSRNIAGYKLPESFTKEINGQKVVFTPNDFYAYLSKANKEDAEGNKVTGYQRDLSKLTDEEYLNRELLDAWLMFTGGSYKDLVDMAVKEDKVRQLKVKSKEQRTAKTVKINRNSSSKADINDILL